jgi:hypothetical protein
VARTDRSTNSFLIVLGAVAIIAISADLAVFVDSVFWLLIVAVLVVLALRPLARRLRH